MIWKHINPDRDSTCHSLLFPWSHLPKPDVRKLDRWSTSSIVQSSFRYITLYVTDTLLSSQLRVSTEMYCSVSEWNEMWYTPQRWDLMSWASSSQNAIWDIVLLRAFMRSIKATNGYSPFNRYSKHETVFAYILQFILIELTAIQFIWNWYARWRLILLCKSTLHMWVGGTPCTAHSHKSLYSIICQQCFILFIIVLWHGSVDAKTWNRRLAGYALALGLGLGYSTPKTFIKNTYVVKRGMPSHWVSDAQVLHKVHVCSVAWLTPRLEIETGYALASWIRCFID